MDDISKYYNIAQFFGCYFHQDFIEEFDSPELALKAFIEDSDKEVIRLTYLEINLLLSFRLNEINLTEIICRLNCNYLPHSDNLTSKQWLIKTSQTMVLKCT